MAERDWTDMCLRRSCWTEMGIMDWGCHAQKRDNSKPKVKTNTETEQTGSKKQSINTRVSTVGNREVIRGGCV